MTKKIKTNKKRVRLNIDKLEITYYCNNELKETLSQIITSERFGECGEIQLVRIESNRYSHAFDIRFDDVDANGMWHDYSFGTLLFGSTNRHRQQIYIQVNNEMFYIPNMLAHRYYIESALGIEFYRISKFDLALDGNFNIRRCFYKFFKDCDLDLYVNCRKINGMKEKIKHVYHLCSNTSRQTPLSLASATPYIKNCDNNLEMSIYDKRTEIEEESNKYYIMEHNEFKQKKFYRMEVRIKNCKAMKDVVDKMKDPITDVELYTHLEDEEYLMRLYKHVLRCLFFYKHKRKEIDFIDTILNI